MIQILGLRVSKMYALVVIEEHVHDISRNQVLSAPDLGRGFHPLHTSLGVFVDELIVAVVVLSRDRPRLGVGGSFFRVVVRAGVLETGIV